MKTRDDFEKLLKEKALKEPEFRNQLLTTPREAIETATGITLPQDIRINVLEEDSHTFYLTLPGPEMISAREELNESELQQVAAGNYAKYTIGNSGCNTCGYCTEKGC